MFMSRTAGSLKAAFPGGNGLELEFHTAEGLTGEGYERWLRDALGSRGFVVQERVVLPGTVSGGTEAAPTAHASLPERCNPALVLTGSRDLPLQRSLVVASPVDDRTVIRKCGYGVLVETGGERFFFGAPIESGSRRAAGGYLAGFGELRRQLHEVGLREEHIVRTWLFMDDILAGYEELNAAREQFFAQWFDPQQHLIPASTGIQGRTPQATPLSIEGWACAGNRLRKSLMASPMQNEPTAYGKLFSRAVSVRRIGQTLLFVSGTASIDRSGQSIHAGDFRRQLKHTLEVIAAILQRADGDFSHIVQGIVFLKRGTDLIDCRQVAAAAGFPLGRMLLLPDTDVCRDDLLCEIEVTAVLPR